MTEQDSPQGKMKKYLAKLLLGRDIYQEFANAEQEMHDAKNKLQKVCADVATLENQMSSLEECLEKEERNISDLMGKKNELDAFLPQGMTTIDENTITLLQTKISEKTEKLSVLKQELLDYESQRSMLVNKLSLLQQEKESLQNEVDALTNRLSVIKAEAKEKEKNHQQLKDKLAQRKQIRDYLVGLIEQWQPKQDEFNSGIENADKHTLIELQHELTNYETLIKNAIDTPVE